MSPVPIYDKRKPSKRRQEAQELTSPEVIAEKKEKLEKKETVCGKKATSRPAKPRRKENKGKTTIGDTNPGSKKSAVGPKKILFSLKKKAHFKKDLSSSDDEIDEDIPYQESDEEDIMETKKNKDECSECLEEYSQTSESCDWIKCVVCNHCLHETCSKFLNKCAVCGRAEILLKIKKEYMKIGKK